MSSPKRHVFISLLFILLAASYQSTGFRSRATIMTIVLRNRRILGTFCNMLFLLLIKAPLGSIPELPAQSCQEIKASEGKDTISGKYWLDPTGNGTTVLVYCGTNLGNCQSVSMSVVC